MDFSYLDKDEYKDIPLLDDSQMSLNGTDIFSIRKYMQEKTGALHRHKYIQINYVHKGSGSHKINRREFDISKGDIFIIPPYVPHTISKKGVEELEIIEFEFSTGFIIPADDASIYMDFAYLEPFIVAEEHVKPYFKLEGELRTNVEHILNEALLEYTKKDEGYILMAKALLLRLLVIVGRAYKGAIKGTETEKMFNKFKDVIHRTKKYINENYDKNISLNEIAKEVNYSKSHFSYLFKAVTGQTFVEYLNEVRIGKAIELLENTNKNVVDISYEVGYNSIANFNKNFKTITGMTPSKYRR